MSKHTPPTHPNTWSLLWTQPPQTHPAEPQESPDQRAEEDTASSHASFATSPSTDEETPKAPPAKEQSEEPTSATEESEPPPALDLPSAKPLSLPTPAPGIQHEAFPTPAPFTRRKARSPRPSSKPIKRALSANQKRATHTKRPMQLNLPLPALAPRAHQDEATLLASILELSSCPPQHARASSLLETFCSLRQLEQAGFSELVTLGGLGPHEANALQAALELGRRLVCEPLRRGASFISSRQIYQAFGPRIDAYAQECFWIIMLDQKHRFLKELQIAQGSINRCPLTPQQVFSPAMRENAVKLVLLHNHPSGDPEPSTEDIQLTSRLQKAGKIVGITILDHLVIGADRYVSFADRGLLHS